MCEAFNDGELDALTEEESVRTRGEAGKESRVAPFAHDGAHTLERAFLREANIDSDRCALCSLCENIPYFLDWVRFSWLELRR